MKLQSTAITFLMLISRPSKFPWQVERKSMCLLWSLLLWRHALLWRQCTDIISHYFFFFFYREAPSKYQIINFVVEYAKTKTKRMQMQMDQKWHLILNAREPNQTDLSIFFFFFVSVCVCVCVLCLFQDFSPLVHILHQKKYSALNSTTLGCHFLLFA